MATIDGVTIDDLARDAGMTVRNVRAHAARGLLPAPRIEGRTGYYGSEHLVRLRLISRLQEQGFSLAAIERLVETTPAGTAEEALEAYLGMLAPWRRERPVELARDGLAAWLGVEVPDDTLAALLRVGLLEDGDHPGTVRVTNPGLLRAGGEAAALGMTPESLIDLRERLVGHVDAVAADFVELFRTTIWARFLADGMTDADLPGVRDAVAALQPVAAHALLAAFREAMPAAMGDFLDEAGDAFDAAAVRDPRP